MKSMGKGRAAVDVLTDPLLGGVAQATNFNTLLTEVLIPNIGMYQLFVLVVDRDGNQARRGALRALETKLQSALNECSTTAHLFVSECAYQEIEVWTLAGLDLPSDWSWREVRADRDPNERFFSEYARIRSVSRKPGGGRVCLGIEAARNYKRIRLLCPEVAHLEARISDYINSGAISGEPFDDRNRGD